MPAHGAPWDRADINGDGHVGIDDLTSVLASFRDRRLLTSSGGSPELDRDHTEPVQEPSFDESRETARQAQPTALGHREGSQRHRWVTLHHVFCFVSYKIGEFKYVDEEDAKARSTKQD